MAPRLRGTIELLDFDAFITACGLCYESYTYITRILQYFSVYSSALFIALRAERSILQPDSEQTRSPGTRRFFSFVQQVRKKLFSPALIGRRAQAVTKAVKVEHKHTAAAASVRRR